MYRVVTKDRGKYNNVVVGARYCFTKRSAASLMANFMSVECECEVEKLVRISKDIFCWSEAEVDSDIWNRIYDALGELTTKED